MIVVPGSGPLPCDVFLCGEAPGRLESSLLRPFVGKSGEEQEAYLNRWDVSARHWRKNNVIGAYLEGNPDPTPDLIKHWTPFLLDEIEQCQPRLVVAVGRFAARWFLGDAADMDTVHGIPHHPGAFDPTRASRVPPGCCILPIYHPAAGLHDPDLRGVIAWDYEQVARVYKLIRRGRERDIPYPIDEHPDATYVDMTGAEFAASILGDSPDVIGLDTEGTPAAPWSIQVSTEPGCGYVLRCTQPDFAEGIDAIAHLASRGTVIAAHNWMWDLAVCRAMGLNLSDPSIRLYDTMYAAYLFRLEPQGLKPLSWRWCGMRMTDYMATIGDIGRGKQIDYLRTVAARTWPKPEPRLEWSNDGTCKVKTPRAIDKGAAAILADIDAGKVNKDGVLTDPAKRWAKAYPDLRATVERELGPLPVATLADIPLAEAIAYAGADPDATLRLYHRLPAALRARGINLDLATHGAYLIPVFEEMQASGMPASRSYFESLASRMWDEMCGIQNRLSQRCYGGRPFNPKSPIHVRDLLRLRGLTARKRTKTGEISTDKGSIEYLRYIDPAIEDVFGWRERQHIKDSFCKTALKAIPGDPSPVATSDHDDPDDPSGDDDSTPLVSAFALPMDIVPVRCHLKITRVATRRLASSAPNLLAIPSRTELGKLVRHGYMTPAGITFCAHDLSQIEARCLAHESRDPLLCRLFREDRDIHIETAARVASDEQWWDCLPTAEFEEVKGYGWHIHLQRSNGHMIPVTKDQRRAAKTTVYGIVYGQQGQGLLTELWKLGMTTHTLESCEALRRSILKIFAGVQTYIDHTGYECARHPHGLVFDHWGMPRYLPGIHSREPHIAAEAARHAVSHRIQGMAQGMIQNSMRWLRPILWDLRESAGLDIRWRLQIHDEIILTFPPDMWPTIDALVLEALTSHAGIRLRVPVLAEGHMADTWGGLK